MRHGPMPSARRSFALPPPPKRFVKDTIRVEFENGTLLGTAEVLREIGEDERVTTAGLRRLMSGPGGSVEASRQAEARRRAGLEVIRRLSDTEALTRFVRTPIGPPNLADIGRLPEAEAFRLAADWGRTKDLPRSDKDLFTPAGVPGSTEALKRLWEWITSLTRKDEKQYCEEGVQSGGATQHPMGELGDKRRDKKSLPVRRDNESRSSEAPEPPAGDGSGGGVKPPEVGTGGHGGGRRGDRDKGGDGNQGGSNDKSAPFGSGENAPGSSPSFSGSDSGMPAPRAGIPKVGPRPNDPKRLIVTRHGQEGVEKVAGKFGLQQDELIRRVIYQGRRMVDRRTGNVNYFILRPDGKPGYVRLTLDPTQERIVSFGLNQERDIASGLRTNRFVPLND